MSNPFRYFNSSPEVIRLVVMMYVGTVTLPCEERETDFQAAATASRHVLIAAARSTR
jgi:hypothetical protein